MIKNIIKSLIQDRIKILKENNNNIAEYGEGYINSTWGKMTELSIAVIDFKLELIDAIVVKPSVNTQ